MRVILSSPSRVNLHVMAHKTRFIATMGRSLRQESLKSSRQIGNLTIKRHHPAIPSQLGRLEMPSSQPRSLLTKAKASGQDPYLFLLDWRNTPSANIGTSPVQRLFGRRTKTLLLEHCSNPRLWKVRRTS